MPTPPIKKPKHYRGDDFRYSFRLEQYIDPDDPSLGTEPVDMTGWGAAVTDDQGGNWTASTPDATGVITLDLPAEDTVDPEVTVIEADCQLTDSTGFRRTYIKLVIALVDQVEAPA